MNSLLPLDRPTIAHFARFRTASALDRAQMRRVYGERVVETLSVLERNLASLGPDQDAWGKWGSTGGSAWKMHPTTLPTLLAGLILLPAAVPDLLRACPIHGHPEWVLEEALKRASAANAKTPPPSRVAAASAPPVVETKRAPAPDRTRPSVTWFEERERPMQPTPTTSPLPPPPAPVLETKSARILRLLDERVPGWRDGATVAEHLKRTIAAEVETSPGNVQDQISKARRETRRGQVRAEARARYAANGAARQAEGVVAADSAAVPPAPSHAVSLDAQPPDAGSLRGDPHAIAVEKLARENGELKAEIADTRANLAHAEEQVDHWRKACRQAQDQAEHYRLVLDRTKTQLREAESAVARYRSDRALFRELATAAGVGCEFVGAGEDLAPVAGSDPNGCPRDFADCMRDLIGLLEAARRERDAQLARANELSLEERDLVGEVSRLRNSLNDTTAERDEAQAECTRLRERLASQTERWTLETRERDALVTHLRAELDTLRAQTVTAPAQVMEAAPSASLRYHLRAWVFALDQREEVPNAAEWALRRAVLGAEGVLPV